MEFPHKENGFILGEQTALYGTMLADRTTHRSMGNQAVRIIKRSVALGAATFGLLASGPIHAESDNGFHPDDVQNAYYGQSINPYIPRHSVLASISSANHHPQVRTQLPNAHHRKTSHTNTSDVSCEWITDFPNGYYEGEACASDIMYKLRVSASRKYDYGMLVVNHVKKCGWIKEGVVPTVNAYGNAGICDKIYKSVSTNPYVILKNINCQPGHCTDGTSHTPVTQPCNVYKNFATAARTPLTINPNKKKSGFSGLLGKEKDFVHYRGTVVRGSKSGNAVVVRSNSRGWGFMSTNCVPPTESLSATHSQLTTSTANR